MIRPRYSRSQKLPVMMGIVSIVLIILVLQLWLLTATMSAFLAGEGEVVIPAAAASLFCLALNGGLLVYIYRMERP
ncbi:MAG: DUF6755 family protein [Acidobacteriota bacterium]